MKKLISSICLLLLLAPAVLFSQLTILVTAIPGNTPPGSSIHIAGTFNNWNASDPAKILTPVGNGQFSIVLNPAVGTVKFKFTRGGWSTVEGNASGGFQPDHETTYNGQPKTVQVAILSWEDLGGGGGGNSTAASNVQIMDDDFYIPQLNRHRRVWLYLPPDYATTTKSYPVLYMHDAQNLFDVQTSFSGEWEVDESLNQLHQQGDYGCIVVGIDNGEGERLNEYSPWVNSEYGGGQGDEYIDFIVSTLKPYVDANYRTMPGRMATGIMGSSMGGLISMYGFSERQDVFSKAGIFSPAFWFADNNPANHVAAHPRQGPARVYFLAGGDEPDYVEQDILQVANAMTTAGFAMSEKYVKVPSDGEHAEWFWAREFPEAYQWLFAGAVSAGHEAPSEEFGVFPNPAGSWVRLTSVKTAEKIKLQIVGADGKVWRNASVIGSDPIWTGDLPKGVYVVKVKKAGQKWVSAKLVRQ